MVDFEQEFNLVVYEEYNKPICYRTEEFFNGIRVISGLYLNKSPVFGNMPRQIILKFNFSYIKEENEKMLRIFSYKYIKPKRKRVYILKNKYYCHSILTFQKVCDGQIFYLYRGETEWTDNEWDEKVKEVYFHKTILGEDYPFQIPVTLIWDEIPDKNNGSTFDFS